MPGTSKNLKELQIIQSESLSGRESGSRRCTVFFGFFLVNYSFILANQILDLISLIMFGYCQRVLTMSNGNALKFFLYQLISVDKKFPDSNWHRFEWASND